MLECSARNTFVARGILGTCEDTSICSNQWETRWMEEHGMPCTHLSDYTPNAENTDVIVFTTPYSHTHGEKMHPYTLMSKGILPVLIPYCTEWLGGKTFAKTYFGMNPLFWRTFTASILSRTLYKEHLNIPAHHVPMVGNPEYDVTRWQDLPKLRKIKDLAKGRKILLWTPHYEADNLFRWCTWEQLGESTTRILRRYGDDLFVVVRPHHFLRNKLHCPAPGESPANSFERAACLMAEAENFWIDDTGQCLESVMACDGLISDCSSLIAKALRLGKSVLYTRRDGSDGAQDITAILKGHAHVTTEVSGVQRFTEMLLRENDPLLPLPEPVKEYLCGPDDGKVAIRIADYLENYFIHKRGVA